MGWDEHSGSWKGAFGGPSIAGGLAWGGWPAGSRSPSRTDLAEEEGLGKTKLDPCWVADGDPPALPLPSGRPGCCCRGPRGQ